MRGRLVSLVWMILVLPTIASAGRASPTAIPTLGEFGLVAAGVGLVATGIAVLRDRKH